MSTEAAANEASEFTANAGDEAVDAALVDLAPPSASQLDAVPGVLGRIARERARDYGDRLEEAATRRRNTPHTERSVPREPFVGADRRAAFVGALATKTGGSASSTLNVIAEVKRSSPSQGAIAPLDPVAAARQYVDGGAAAISVLTEERHFGGELTHLEQVAQDRATWHRYVPLLRKDFTVHPLQLHEAREAGGDAVLLIVAVLGTSTARFLRAAHGHGLAALVEVHDDAELDLALESGAEVIGVNNRDLTTLNVDLATAPRLLARARDAGYQGVLVAESGYRTREDLAPVEGLADAVLVGTSLAGSRDLAGALRRLRGVEA